MKISWMQKNTFHHSDFSDVKQLVDAKERQGLKISLCLPTLNEEETIAKQILIMRSELMTRYPLLDEIVVIDSGSEDRTVEVARSFDADVYAADDILPELGLQKGKGENLWKALYVTRGDIIVYLDADIRNIHHRFAYALVAPLLLDGRLKYVKAFYDRPIAIDTNKVRPTGGGRVTELVIRPIFSLFFPELTQILQPLSGEYAGYRSVFDKLSFPIGYGIETSMLLDICERWGMDVIAQVDLDKRIHRNQDTKALGKMAFVILKTFFNRIEQLGMVELKHMLFNRMIQYNTVESEYRQEMYTLSCIERPPMITIPAYREKFNIQ